MWAHHEWTGQLEMNNGAFNNLQSSEHNDFRKSIDYQFDFEQIFPFLAENDAKNTHALTNVCIGCLCWFRGLITISAYVVNLWLWNLQDLANHPQRNLTQQQTNKIKQFGPILNRIGKNKMYTELQILFQWHFTRETKFENPISIDYIKWFPWYGRPIDIHRNIRNGNVSIFFFYCTCLFTTLASLYGRRVRTAFRFPSFIHSFVHAWMCSILVAKCIHTSAKQHHAMRWWLCHLHACTCRAPLIAMQWVKGIRFYFTSESVILR